MSNYLLFEHFICDMCVGGTAPTFIYPGTPEEGGIRDLVRNEEERETYRKYRTDLGWPRY